MSAAPCDHCVIVPTGGPCICRPTAPTTTLTLDDINPRRLVSANRRIHHYVRAEVCAYWRQLAYVTARGHGPYDRVRVVVEVRFPDQRRRDVGNLYPYVAKPLVDGLVDARVIPDDDDHHCIGPDLRRDPDSGAARVRVHITPLEEV